MNSLRFKEALMCATNWHADQRRKATHIPYLSHLLAVASYLMEDGENEDVVIAGLLHDAIEDQGVTTEELGSRFGTYVAVLVKECSDADTIPKPPWRERKEAHLEHLQTARLDTLRIVRADKLHNLNSMLRDFDVQGKKLWDRFNAGPEDILWYHEEIYDVIRGRLPITQRTVELRRAVNDLYPHVRPARLPGSP